ncbi:MAG: alpha/beta hydrolase [Gammaproteobacteria bacterium]|nr:alpha/beta hydrolase [Gammaproteobacteria bacterium]
MALTEETKLVLAARAGSPMAEMHKLSPSEARAGMLSMVRAGPKGEDVAHVEDRNIPGPGVDVPIRIYRPQSDSALPALVYFHGGGWVIGDIETHDGICRALANEAKACIVSVHYRLAPEARFPAAPDDCFAATEWVRANAKELGVDAARIAVGGDSAGGNLAAAVALMARNREVTPPAAQVLVYPVTDYGFDRASYKENGSGDYGLGLDAMKWFWDHYLENPEDGDHPYASPMRCKDVANLPPALVITAQYDPLRDEGHDYADRLEAAGVKTQRTLYAGVVHGFLGQSAVVPEGRKAIEEIAAFMNSAM